MAQITVVDLYSIDSATFLDDLSYEKTKSVSGGRLSRWQLDNLDRKLDYLNYRQYQINRRISDDLDQRMYKEIMSWDIPNNM